MDALSAEAEREYRRFVWEDPGFARFFAAFTPVRELALLPDPMSAIQVELLAAHRAGAAAAARPLMRSIAGIAAALRHTG